MALFSGGGGGSGGSGPPPIKSKEPASPSLSSRPRQRSLKDRLREGITGKFNWQKHVKNRFVRDESRSITEVPLYSLTSYIIRETNLHTHGTFSSLPRKSTLRYDSFFFIHITMVFGSYVFRSVDAFLYLLSLGYL